LRPRFARTSCGNDDRSRRFPVVDRDQQLGPGAYGWRVLEEMLGGLYIGPEVQYFGSDGYRHGRLGIHITSMKTEDTEWSAAAGWARDSAGRASPYVRLSLLTRR
jgi:hypothetical protein